MAQQIAETTIQLAQGRWIGILTACGIDPECLDGNHHPCPSCGGKDRFRFDDKDGSGSYFCSGCGAGYGMDLLIKIKYYKFADAARVVDKILGVPRRGFNKGTNGKLMQVKAGARKYLRQIKSQAVKVKKGDPVWLYLENRGVKPGRDMFYHPSMPYYHNGKSTKHPAMLAVVRNPAGDPITYHVTYLTKTGKKANVEVVRKMMTPTEKTTGAAIRLASGDLSAVIIAEGIETVLSVIEAMSEAKIKKAIMSCFAVLNTNGMKSFEPPKGTKHVSIYGDNDSHYAGQAAAYVLANKLMMRGINVDIYIPPKQGQDYNDVLMERKKQ